MTIKQASTKLEFWSGRDSSDPFYITIKFTDLLSRFSTEHVIDWNNRAAH